ncbi:MAG: enoyl-CoA hydratase/isomerase family protein [Chloroflexi bacterium]|nr:enoyl-CoA hydratase/isomerase family protein [Chloroflexota bacterium]
MAYQHVLYEVEGKVGTITLNRPEKLNALSTGLMADFDAALQEAGRDQRVSVVRVKGAGRAFSAGYDISGTDAEARAERGTIYEDRERLHHNLERWLAIWELPKPVVAQVHGYCIAGATQLASLCDLTFVAADARLGMPSLPLGAGYVTTFWVWLVGIKRAKELHYLLGQHITGLEAAQMGFANRAFPAERLEEEVLAICRRIAKIHPQLLRLEKLATNRVLEIQGFRAAVLQGAEWDAIAHFTPAVQEMQGRIRERGLRGAIESWQKQG